MDEWYYLQDSRQYVGNDVLWWRKGNNGYTTDLREAAVFPRERAFARAKQRSTDVPWPKSYIDGKTRPAVDMQYIDHREAMRLQMEQENGKCVLGKHEEESE